MLAFATVGFALLLVPFAFHLIQPRLDDSAIKRVKDWTVSHERQIAAAVALLAGAFMVITGTVRVLS